MTFRSPHKQTFQEAVGMSQTCQRDMIAIQSRRFELTSCAEDEASSDR